MVMDQADRILNNVKLASNNRITIGPYGEIYKSFDDMCKDYMISPAIVSNRINRGIGYREALIRRPRGLEF